MILFQVDLHKYVMSTYNYLTITSNARVIFRVIFINNWTDCNCIQARRLNYTRMKFDRLNSYKKLAKQTLKNHAVSQKHVSLGLYTCTHVQH